MTSATRVALVTGASRGIGRSIAFGLGATGAHVVCMARSAPDLEQTRDEIAARGGSASIFVGDLRRTETFATLAAELGRDWGRLDILVGNAGLLGPVAPLVDVGESDWSEVLAVNTTANWRLLRALDPLLRQAPSARAVFISAGITRDLFPRLGVYAVSKAGLETLIRTYALESADSGIRVNLFNPGPIRTSMRAAVVPGEDPLSVTPPEALLPDLMAMLAPDYDQSGVVFDFPTRKTIRF